MFLLINLTGCKTEMNCKSKWSEDIQINGVQDDWQKIPSTILDNKKVGFAFANDKENLYAVLFFSEPFWAMGIKREGLNIWYDTKLKNIKNTGFTFCGGPRLNDIMANQKNLPENIKGKIPSEIQNYVVFHCENELDKRVDLDELKNLDIAFNSDRNLFVYEFAIPMQEIFADSISYHSKAEPKVQICLEWGSGNKMNRSKSERGMETGFESPGLGRSGRGGKGGRKPPANAPQMPEDQEIWIELHLAKID